MSRIVDRCIAWLFGGLIAAIFALLVPWAMHGGNPLFGAFMFGFLTLFVAVFSWKAATDPEDVARGVRATVRSIRERGLFRTLWVDSVVDIACDLGRIYRRARRANFTAVRSPVRFRINNRAVACRRAPRARAWRRPRAAGGRSAGRSSDDGSGSSDPDPPFLGVHFGRLILLTFLLDSEAAPSARAAV